MNEPRKREWNRDGDFDALRDLYRDFEEAKAGFNPQDVPYITDYTGVDKQGQPVAAGELGEPVYKVRRVTRRRNLLQNEQNMTPLPKRAAQITSELAYLDTWESDIIQHFKTIQSLARAISENEYVKRFYPNNVHSWVYLKEGRPQNSVDEGDYIDITGTAREEDFSIERVNHNVRFRTWDIEATYSKLMSGYV